METVDKLISIHAAMTAITQNFRTSWPGRAGSPPWLSIVPTRRPAGPRGQEAPQTRQGTNLPMTGVHIQ